MSKSLIPKHSIRVSDLVERTGCNGQGCTVAVLDTGVDPGAAGLRETPDGKPKIVDVVDCTGSGDVDMSKISELEEDFTVLGMGERVLYLGAELCAMNPSKKFHVGCKPAYDLMPIELKDRIEQERKTEWLKKNKEKVNGILVAISNMLENKEMDGDENKAELADLEAQKDLLISLQNNYEDMGPVYDCVTFFDGQNWRAIVGENESGDLSGCEVLEDYRINCNYGTIGDGILMNFGVNIYEGGNLLSIVCDVGDHGTHVAGIIGAYYPDSPELNGMAPGSQIVSLRIGDRRLGVGATHKCYMRAMAYMLEHSKPKSGEKENGPDEITIDIANMSYGGPTEIPNCGQFKEALELLVHNHNVLFVSGVGNDGPALSSVIAPGGTTEAVIGVGAYVTPGMISEAYFRLPSELEDSGGDNNINPSEASNAVSERNQNGHTSSLLSSESYSVSNRIVNAIPYTFSSRGPVFDGALGTSICAPGGAIAPVPQWYLHKNQLNHGTSMSSPSAAGAISVILSFLKQKKILYSSIMLRRAIEFTANRLENSGFQSKDADTKDLVFACGSGSIDALGVCQHLETHHMNAAASDNLLTNPFYWNFQTRVEVVEGGERVQKYGTGLMNSTRVIYRRGHFETQHEHKYQVIVDPISPDDEDKVTKETRTNMEIKFKIRSTAPWIEVPPSFRLMGGWEGFPIKVDPSKLESGKVYYAQIEGFIDEKDNNMKAPLFKVPVTVIKPESLRDTNSCYPITNVVSSTGNVLRKFYEVPLGAKLVKIKVTPGEKFLAYKAGKTGASVSSFCESPTVDSRVFEVHMVQHYPNESFKDNYYRTTITLNSKSTHDIVHEVQDGKLLEVCIAQLWRSPGPCAIEKIEISFSGLTVDPPMLIATPMAKCFDKIEVSQKCSVPTTGNQNGTASQLVPNANISRVERCVTPDNVSFSTLGKRDHIQEYGNTTEMKIKYTLEIPEDICEIMVSIPDMDQESDIMAGPFLFILNNNGQIMDHGVGSLREIVLSKGTYTLDLYVSHFDGQFLEKFRDTKGHISYGIESISMRAYKSRNGAIHEMESDQVDTIRRNLQSGESVAMIFSAPDADRIPEWTRTGDILLGTLSLDGECSDSFPHEPIPSYPIIYHVHKEKKSSKEENSCIGEDISAPKPDSDQNISSIIGYKMLELKTSQLRDLLSAEKLHGFDDLFTLFVDKNQGNVHLNFKLLHLERLEKEILDQTDPKTNMVELLALASKAIETCVEIITPTKAGESSEKKDDGNVDIALKEYAVKCAMFRKLRILSKLCLLDENAEVTMTEIGEEKSIKAGDLLATGIKEAETEITIDEFMSPITCHNQYHKTINSADLVLLGVRIRLIEKKYGPALKLYQDYFSKPSNEQYVTKDGHMLKIEIMHQLGWKHQEDGEKSRSHIMFPEHWNKY